MLATIYMVAGLAVMGAVGTAHAVSLLGTSVTGELTFEGVPVNQFDPLNGHVPAGYLNAAGTTVTIQEPEIEFGFQFSTTVTANFTADELILSDVYPDTGVVGSWQMTFQSAAFVGATIFEASDNFANGGVDLLSSGDTLTFNWAGRVRDPFDYTASYRIVAAVPEPSTLVLMGLGLVGLGYAGRRKLMS